MAEQVDVHNKAINSRILLQNLLGQRVTCTLSDGRTATGRFVCLDRLRNVILSDCTCNQQICSSDYTQHTAVPVYQTVSRHLQQAMIPGTHLVSVHLCMDDDTKAVYEHALTMALTPSVAESANPKAGNE